MGLLIYLLIYMITVMLIIDSRIIPSRLFFLIWFTVMVCLSLSIRWRMIHDGQLLGEGDLSAFVLNMRLESNFVNYHFREPLFWLGINYLYKIIGNPGLVFVVTDVILFLTFYKSVSLLQSMFSKPIKFENLKYLYFGAFLFYPYFTGMHNHYRQILAMTVVMCAIGLSAKDSRKSLFVFLISISIHNAMLMLYPILLLAKKSKKMRQLLFMGVLAIILILFLPLYLRDEIIRRLLEVGTSDTVSVRNEIYLYVLIFVTFFIIILEYTTKGRVQKQLITVTIFLTIIYFCGFWFFPNHAASRVFFMVLTLLYLLIGIYIETKFKTGLTVRLFYLHLSLVPLLGVRGDGLVYEFG